MPPPPDWPSEALTTSEHIGRYAVDRYAVEVMVDDGGMRAVMTPRADAGDFLAPLSVELRRQQDDATGELHLSRAPNNRLAAQQRFTRLPDGRRALWFRGRLIPEAPQDA